MYCELPLAVLDRPTQGRKKKRNIGVRLVRVAVLHHVPFYSLSQIRRALNDCKRSQILFSNSFILLLFCLFSLVGLERQLKTVCGEKRGVNLAVGVPSASHQYWHQ